MSEYHRFSVEAATKYGVACALLLEHIKHWVTENRANGVNRHNGKYWMYKSIKGFSISYPYFTENQIRRAIEKLRNEGLIVTGHFSKGECTRTLWYTLTKKGQALVSASGFDLASLPNGNGNNAETDRQESQSEQANTPDSLASLPNGNGNNAISSIEISKEPLIETINKEKLEEEDARARGSDTDWTAFVREYQNNIGLLPTSTVEREDMTMFFEEYGIEALREFIHYTARKHPDNPHVYFSNLCRRYLGKGITTAEQARAAFLDHDRAKKGGRNGGENRGRASEPPRRIGRETIV